MDGDIVLADASSEKARRDLEEELKKRRARSSPSKNTARQDLEEELKKRTAASGKYETLKNFVEGLGRA